MKKNMENDMETLGPFNSGPFKGCRDIQGLGNYNRKSNETETGIILCSVSSSRFTF